mmetsp:Transcript_34842/g.88304  ORF Transcript_34842/g.88304 Transcript_34842/m.88304 type:complete len:210 (-) Transcript_34842:256-885(-)
MASHPLLASSRPKKCAGHTSPSFQLLPSLATLISSSSGTMPCVAWSTLSRTATNESVAAMYCSPSNCDSLSPTSSGTSALPSPRNWKCSSMRAMVRSESNTAQYAPLAAVSAEPSKRLMLRRSLNSPMKGASLTTLSVRLRYSVVWQNLCESGSGSGCSPPRRLRCLSTRSPSSSHSRSISWVISPGFSGPSSSSATNAALIPLYLAAR